MSTSPWLHSQQQQQHKNHQQYPSIFRSATPPPPTRPRSAAATNSPLRGRHVIPRSLSVLHARPPSAPRSSASPAPLVDCDSPQPQATAADQNPGAVGVGHHVQVDYSAIQRIADGVERMVRSWTSENSCRAQVYAKAYDSLHAAAARGKDQEIDSGVVTQHQHHPPHELMNACTDTASFNFNLHSDTSAHPLALQNLQSPAHPHSAEMSQSILQHTRENNLVNVDQMQESTHGGQTSYAGHADYIHANWSRGAPYAPTRIPDLINSNHHVMANGEVLYTEGHSYDHDAKKLKTSNMCVHNHTHNPPIGLGLTSEDDDTEKRSSGNIPHLGHYNSNQRDGLRVDYNTKELARIQHGRSQQEELGPGVPLHLQQHYERINHLQSAPVDDMINSKSLIKSAIRSRSPSLRLGPLSNNASNSLDIYHESIKNDRRLDEKYEAKVKELEISLLECATEYEVQLVEMKMKMLQMKSEFRQKGTPEDNKLASSRPFLALTQDAANVAQNNSKVNRQANASPEVSPDQSLEPANLKRRPLKEKYSENVSPSRPKTRPEAAQKKSGLEDSGKIVTCLQKLLSKKEQELVNSKIREKELAGQIHELQTTVQRGRVTQMEPKKLLSLLLALNEWLQSVKAGVLNDDPNLHRKAYQNVHALAHLRMNLEEPQLANRTNNQSPRIENLAAIVNKEIKTLQEILGKLTPHRKGPK